MKDVDEADGPRSVGKVCILGSATNTTNVDLVRNWRNAGLDALLVSPLETLSPEAVAIGRLDVLPTLDGVEPGLLALLFLERRGFGVLNRAKALLAVHDKLLTARRLDLAGLPHPRTVGWHGEGEAALEPPFVVKPRFGSWGGDVFLCWDGAEASRTLRAMRERPWFGRHGALLQELVPSSGWDLRLIVAGGEVVGAGKRIAASGEWRTNVSLGGSIFPVEPSSAATKLAVAAASSVGADFVGVDLIPSSEGGYVIIEMNGAVEFDNGYSLSERGVHLDVAVALDLLRGVGHAGRSPAASPPSAVTHSSGRASGWKPQRIRRIQAWTSCSGSRADLSRHACRIGVEEPVGV